MITFVRGEVAAVRPTEAVLDVGGVGLALHCTPATTSTLHLGQSAQLAASLVVREDSLTLYGFADDDERSVFELVQTASGVGPRLAQAMLSVHSPDELRRAVATEDLTALTKVPGIGKKGAQRIVIELKDKLGPAGSVPATAPVSAGAAPAAGSWQSQVHEALLGLGWPARDAERAVDTVAQSADGSAPDVATMLKAALRTLAK
ncbi:Holliday junction DNA helicase subunit RuvA [Haloactinopolyspora alba]|uniref:Holliday junction branch migration complex subunit RuvA n=1 Tax=Haloactinopolyspora alba TaxID=648780 RepID=A0A2P8DI90_9ACTN|nr:Holliday junction branch migration protein RuvA [Haloactinopolyspora alba]PSK96935.1 Holliday junction DNA helicase subunit RuvA [Haloactinopolyspora alba]